MGHKISMYIKIKNMKAIPLWYLSFLPNQQKTERFNEA